MESVFKIENLRYKDILKNVTFSLKEKSFNILIGANGSGKTTLVNCIRGLLEFDGSIIIFDNYITSNNNSHKEIGFFIDEELFLEDIIFEELLTLLKNLDYEEEKAKKRIYSVAKKLDITHLLFKKKEALSNQEKKLVSFLFSIIHEPKLIILDCDFENLNNKYKIKIFDYLKTQKKLTTLFITTNNNYFYMADNLIFLDDGKIILMNTLEEIMNNEKIFIKCGSSLPFLVELSNKLISYELLKSNELDIEKMVNEIWK